MGDTDVNNNEDRNQEETTETVVASIPLGNRDNYGFVFEGLELDQLPERNSNICDTNLKNVTDDYATETEDSFEDETEDSFEDETEDSFEDETEESFEDETENNFEEETQNSFEEETVTDRIASKEKFENNDIVSRHSTQLENNQSNLDSDTDTNEDSVPIGRYNDRYLQVGYIDLLREIEMKYEVNISNENLVLNMKKYISIKGSNWMHFTHRLYCHLEFKLPYLKNLKL